jgi:hypothetical protein
MALLVAYAAAAAMLYLLIFTDPRSWAWPVVGIAVVLVAAIAVSLRGRARR